ncbi:hypothetical protein ACKLTP_17470, partial [Paenarthrobacter ureafaciens]
HKVDFGAKDGPADLIFFIAAPDGADHHQVFFGQVTTCRDRDGEVLAFKAGRFGSFNDFGHAEIPWMF